MTNQDAGMTDQYIEGLGRAVEDKIIRNLAYFHSALFPSGPMDTQPVPQLADMRVALKQLREAAEEALAKLPYPHFNAVQ